MNMKHRAKWFLSRKIFQELSHLYDESEQSLQSQELRTLIRKGPEVSCDIK